MNVGKSTLLLQADFNYRERGMGTMLYTAAIHDRGGFGMIHSRIDLTARANTYDEATDLRAEVEEELKKRHLHCVLVDEAQSLTRAQVLQHLGAGQRLRLVDQHAVEMALLQLLLDLGAKVGRLVIGVGPGGQVDARMDHAEAAAVVDRGGIEHRPHAPLAIVEIGLQQQSRFADVHRRIIEIELGHAGLLAGRAGFVSLTSGQRRLRLPAGGGPDSTTLASGQRQPSTLSAPNRSSSPREVWKLSEVAGRRRGHLLCVR